MIDIDLLTYCPECKKIHHKEGAIYCCFCGIELKNKSLWEFYLSLKIPQDKVTLEKRKERGMSIFSNFPFFLHKSDDTSVQAITFHEYPNGHQVYAKLPSKYHSADESKQIILTEKLLDELLLQGFEWFHESEMDTLW